MKSPARIVEVAINGVEDYIRIYNGTHKLTDMEIAVLGKLIKYQKKHDTSPFRAEARKEIAFKLGITTINQYISSLHSKDAIQKESGEYSINPMLIPGKHRFVVFKLNVKTKASKDERHMSIPS